MKTLFAEDDKFKLLYIGTENNFASQKFHELCDNKGPTVSLCKTEFYEIFGFYTSVPWKSIGDGQSIAGNAFAFKFLPSAKILQIKQKGDMAHVWHACSHMFSDLKGLSIISHGDKANNKGYISPEIYDFPQQPKVDPKTFLAGAEYFKMREVEVF